MPPVPNSDRDSSLTTSPQILGAREDQEDRYITLTPGSIKSRKELALFAVYDGQ
jgi:hypothetical protein